MHIRWLLSVLTFGLFGCGSFQDKIVSGVPNLVQAFPGTPGLWRMGQPPDAVGWQYVAATIAKTGQHVTVVKLNDEAEGSDAPAEALAGWSVVRVPIPPFDDQPWTVLVMPLPKDVQHAIDVVLAARAAGGVVVWHCSHGRDRTGLLAALVGMKLLGWSKDQAWKDMNDHGFRWELPDLDAYWLGYVR